VEDNVQTDEVLMGDNLSSYKMECHSQHGARRTAVLPVRRDRALSAISLDKRSCHVRAYAEW
jgi:hypothetical protein